MGGWRRNPDTSKGSGRMATKEVIKAGLKAFQRRPEELSVCHCTQRNPGRGLPESIT
jgi:hypothetical protein